MIRKGSAVLILGLLVLFAGCKRSSDSSPEPLSGKYEVVSEDSLVSFTSIKELNEEPATDVGGTFDQVSGALEVNEDAALNETTGQISVKLGSLSTENEERDENILTHFFRAIGDNVVSETMEFSINKMKFKKEGRSSLPLNKPAQLEAIGELSVLDSSFKQKAQLMVTRLSEDRVMVFTREPLNFKIDKYDMKEPLNKLMEVCDHPGVSNVVPAQFYIVFEQSNAS